MRKRILSLLLTGALLFSNFTLVPAAAADNSEPTSEIAVDEGSVEPVIGDAAYYDGESEYLPSVMNSTTTSLTYNGTYYYSKAYEVLELTNAERTAQGLEPLSMDVDLLNAAMQRAGETAFLFSHTRPNGSTCFSACPAKMNGENIAAGTSTAAATMNQWMNSDGHRENILGTSFTSIGIGCFQINGQTFWVQCFGTRNADTSSQPEDCDVTVTSEITVGSNVVGLRNQSGSPVTSKTVTVGTTYKLVPFVTNNEWTYVSIPINPENYSWTSSDPSIASVDVSGCITALAPGTSTITCTANDGSGNSDSFELTSYIPAESISISQASASLRTGDTLQLTASVLPANASNTGITWKSSNSSIATVDQSGLVTALTGGSCSITAVSDENKNIQSSCTLNIGYQLNYHLDGGTNHSKNPAQYYGTSITLQDPTRDGYIFQGWYTNADYSSRIKTIRGYAATNYELYAKWRKPIPAASISLNQTTWNTVPGNTKSLIAMVSPSNADDTDVSWTSSDSSVATVDANGSVNVVGYGSAVITATLTADTKIKTSCQISSATLINYELGGGTNNSKNPAAYTGHSITLSDPTRSGYTFAGWYTENTFTNQISSISAPQKRNYDLYAKWIKVSVGVPSLILLKNPVSSTLTVQYSAVNDALGYQIQYSEDSTYPSASTKMKNVTGTTVTLTGLKADTTYYVRIRAYKKDSTDAAVYGSFGSQKSCQIHYKLNGGTNSSSNLLNYYNTAVTLKNPTRAGYIFKGWYTDSTLSSKITSIAKGTAKNYTLYAKWEKISVAKEAITSISNPINSTMRVTYNKISDASGYQVTYSTSSTFSKTTTKTLNTTSTAPTIKKLKSNTTYYVKVRAYKKDSCGSVYYGSYSSILKGYSIKYVLNGGNNSSSNVIRYYNTAVSLKSPTRSGYTFAGWYTSKTYKTRITSIPKGKRTNYTLYAKWIKK